MAKNNAKENSQRINHQHAVGDLVLVIKKILKKPTNYKTQPKVHMKSLQSMIMEMLLFYAASTKNALTFVALNLIKMHRNKKVKINYFV